MARVSQRKNVHIAEPCGARTMENLFRSRMTYSDIWAWLKRTCNRTMKMLSYNQEIGRINWLNCLVTLTGFKSLPSFSRLPVAKRGLNISVNSGYSGEHFKKTRDTLWKQTKCVNQETACKGQRPSMRPYTHHHGLRPDRGMSGQGLAMALSNLIAGETISRLTASQGYGRVGIGMRGILC